MAAETGHDHIFPSVVIQVTERRPAPGYWSRDSGISAFEPAVVIDRQQRQFEIVQRGIDVFHIVQYMALSHEQVFPTVVVEVHVLDNVEHIDPSLHYLELPLL